MDFIEKEIADRQDEVRRLAGTLSDRLRMNVEAKERFPDEVWIFGTPGYDLDNYESIAQATAIAEATVLALRELQYARKLLSMRPVKRTRKKAETTS
jgi:hypothetical protein